MNRIRIKWFGLDSWVESNQLIQVTWIMNWIESLPSKSFYSWVESIQNFQSHFESIQKHWIIYMSGFLESCTSLKSIPFRVRLAISRWMNAIDYGEMETAVHIREVSDILTFTFSDWLRTSSECLAIMWIEGRGHVDYDSDVYFILHITICPLEANIIPRCRGVDLYDSSENWYTGQ